MKQAPAIMMVDTMAVDLAFILVAADSPTTTTTTAVITVVITVTMEASTVTITDCTARNCVRQKGAWE